MSVHINDMIRAGRQREAQVPDDRRFEELPHDEGRLGHVAVPRPGVPCPPVQVSRRFRNAEAAISLTRGRVTNFSLDFLSFFFLSLSFFPSARPARRRSSPPRARGKRASEVPQRQQHQRPRHVHERYPAAPVSCAGLPAAVV